MTSILQKWLLPTKMRCLQIKILLNKRRLLLLLTPPVDHVSQSMEYFKRKRTHPPIGETEGYLPTNVSLSPMINDEEAGTRQKYFHSGKAVNLYWTGKLHYLENAEHTKAGDLANVIFSKCSQEKRIWLSGNGCCKN